MVPLFGIFILKFNISSNGKMLDAWDKMGGRGKGENWKSHERVRRARNLKLFQKKLLWMYSHLQAETKPKFNHLIEKVFY